MPAILTEAEEKRYAELQLLALNAARTGDTPLLASMVDAGLPANLEDEKGNSLLMLASYHGNEDTVASLLERGAQPDRRNHRNQTPLGGVAFKGYTGIAALLLDHGAELNADQGGGTTPLMLAALFGRADMMRLLAERGASATSRNRWGFSARFLGRISRVLAHVHRLFRKAPRPARLEFNAGAKPAPQNH